MVVGVEDVKRGVWSDKVQQDLVTLRLKPEDADDRYKWRKRTHVADPSSVRD